jgi:hypothetical protein
MNEWTDPEFDRPSARQEGDRLEDLEPDELDELDRLQQLKDRLASIRVQEQAESSPETDFA